MRLYLRALRYFRADRRQISVLLVLIFLSITIGLLQAWPMAILVDSVFSPSPHSNWVHRLFLAPLPHTRLGQIVGITLIGAVLKVAQDSIAMCRTMLNNRLRFSGLARTRYQLFAKIQELGFLHQKSWSQGEALYRLETDALGIYGVLDNCIAAAVAAVMLFAMAAIMLSRNVPLTACALSVAPVLLLANYWFGRRIKILAFESKQADANFTTTAQRSLSTLNLVQAFSRQRQQRRHFAAAIRGTATTGLRLNWQEALYPLTRDIIFAIGDAITFGYGGYLAYMDQFVHPNPNGLTIGDLMVFMAYFSQLWDPLSRLAGSGASIQASAAASQRVFDVLDQPVSVAERSNPICLPPAPRTLSLNDVTFGYDQGQPVLRGVSFEILPYQSVAFVGASGAGKSTLLHLINRFVDPWSGTVKLDGLDLRDIAIADIRRHVSLVSQDNPLMSATVAENIAFGRPEASLSEIVAVAKMTGAHEFIERLPLSYDTVVAEAGQNFSGGQRQRLAIARALLADAPILVLDEPASAQDPLNERQVMDALHQKTPTRTLILMTHRLLAAATCDQIFVMHHGQIVERGTHSELLDLGAHYFRLWHSQFPASSDSRLSRISDETNHEVFLPLSS